MDDQTKSLIQNHIDTNDVCLFMKGTPDQPQCGFSMTVSNILKMLEINFKGINVLEDQSLRDGIKKTFQYIKDRGVRPFDYNIKIEINNELTPSTWKNKEI